MSVIKYRLITLVIGFLGLVFFLPLPWLDAETSKTEIDFNTDIRPILSNKCFHCHGPDAEHRKGGKKGKGIRLDNGAGAFEDLGGYQIIVAGHPEKSDLIERVITEDEDDIMPPPKKGKRLTEKEVALLRQWIKEGAKYSKHWSYVRPKRVELPQMNNAIDYFILKRLKKEALKPAPEADRYSLLRRLTMDLTGLPPSLEETDRFINDKNPEAYENLVDRLLSSSAYGEHWARSWLDLARYADSFGYAQDTYREIWLYRDWVVKAINDNMPFDQFTIEQLAGDLLKSPTQDQIIATGFNRNTMTNNEGGVDREEFRVVAVKDRINTMMQVWMGTTATCSQCHDHKYDPISQKDFYQMYSIFNNTEDANHVLDEPKIFIYKSDEEKEKIETLKKEINDTKEKIGKTIKEKKDEFIKAQEEWEGTANLNPKRISKTIGKIIKIEKGDRNKKQKQQLKDYFSTLFPATKTLSAELKMAEKKLDAIKINSTLIMKEIKEKDKRRKAHIHLRGNFTSLGEEVSEGVPEELFPFPADLPKNRLGFAQWLVHKDNPLTSRVIVNRYWELLFGIGLVSTSEEFGSQGERPSHPELLDWLATEFIRLNWDSKKIIRLMVTSATYRQSSVVVGDYQRDPDNRLLSRGPRFRMSAEMIRDQALFVSGLLSKKMYGPSVKPPQPKFGLKAAFGKSTDWEDDTGENRYRRGLYTTWRRSAHYPSMAVFDAPSREFCTVRRIPTNTPLQALAMMNDPVYWEAAQALALRVLSAKEHSTLDSRLTYAFHLCLTRSPKKEELTLLKGLYKKIKKHISEEATRAEKITGKSLIKVPKEIKVLEAATWTMLANSLLNLDEMIMKR